MSKRNLFRSVFIGAAIVVLIAAMNTVRAPETPVSAGTVYNLQAPSFIESASEGASDPAVPEGLNDAGISAYFNAGEPINLALVVPIYRTIEISTTEYIIGSVPVQGYPESEDVHAYVHVDGWVMAYYSRVDPVAKIFHWRGYPNPGNTIGTKLEMTLEAVATAAQVFYPGPTFYDFRYPNASRMMLIAETYWDGNDFYVTLPSSFTFYERSWGLYDGGGNGFWRLNGVSVGDCIYPAATCEGYLSAGQMPPDQRHHIEVQTHGGLALMYRVP